jgi:hypothetical protein
VTPAGPQGDRHLHVHLTDQHTTYYDLVTEFLQAAGKAPDWYWRLVGSFGTHEAEKMEEIISTAFEAGAFISHDHAEDLEFDWVTEEECAQERQETEQAEGGEPVDEHRGSSPATRAPVYSPPPSRA